MNILIKNGRVIDPATKTDKISDLYIEAGKIKEIKDEITPSKQDKVIDAKGCYVVPGLIDLHVHLPWTYVQRGYCVRLQSSGKGWIYHNSCHAKYQAGH